MRGRGAGASSGLGGRGPGGGGSQSGRPALMRSHRAVKAGRKEGAESTKSLASSTGCPAARRR